MYGQEDCLFQKSNIKIIINSKKLKINSGEIILFINHFEINQGNNSPNISIYYKDIGFYAIEKQKKMIILNDGKNYNMINLYLNNEEDTIDLFNNFCNYLKNNKEDDIKLDEEENIDIEKKLKEWENKMIFNDNNDEICQENNKRKKMKTQIDEKLDKDYQNYNYENTIDKLNFK